MKTAIEIKNKYRGFTYLVLAMSGGWRCGYVKINKKHPLHGLHYTDQTPITFEKISKESFGKRGVFSLFRASEFKSKDRISMDILFDVHGSVTFTGKLNDINGWWIGFDCAHVGDKKDKSIMDKEVLAIEEKYPEYGDGVVRTKEYVESECKSLIDQIIKWFPA